MKACRDTVNTAVLVSRLLILYMKSIVPRRKAVRLGRRTQVTSYRPALFLCCLDIRSIYLNDAVQIQFLNLKYDKLIKHPSISPDTLTEQIFEMRRSFMGMRNYWNCARGIDGLLYSRLEILSVLAVFKSTRQILLIRPHRANVATAKKLTSEMMHKPKLLGKSF